MQQINHVAVIGAGLMGQQIALNAALSGFNVVLNDASIEALTKAQKWAGDYLAGRVAKGRLNDDEVLQTKNRLSFEADLVKAVKQADLVIEAIIEDREIKQQLFQQLDQLTPKHAILASNSSRIVSSELAKVTRRPAQVANLHYFNPALVMQLVEVVQGPHTSEQTSAALMAFCRANNKIPILLKKEIDGFVVNRILGKVTDEALFLLEQGVATAEEIDLGVEKGLNYPIGPFKLMDLTGIDLAYMVRRRRTDKTDDSYDANYHLPKVLEQKYQAGEFGRKTGKGWYEYNK